MGVTLYEARGGVVSLGIARGDSLPTLILSPTGPTGRDGKEIGEQDFSDPKEGQVSSGIAIRIHNVEVIGIIEAALKSARILLDARETNSRAELN